MKFVCLGLGHENLLRFMSLQSDKVDVQNSSVEVDCFAWGLVVIYSLPRRREVGKISIYTLMEGVRKIRCYVLYVKLLYQCVRDVVKRNIVRLVPSLLSADRSTDIAAQCLDYRGLSVCILSS